eukprot:GILI01014428.1.p1 GENE.GILI01014428.1~~GILI01014428.1.p1  ORF type:complete len:438 (-),score=114.31 GILI01014428.1:444-1703(-)
MERKSLVLLLLLALGLSAVSADKTSLRASAFGGKYEIPFEDSNKPSIYNETLSQIGLLYSAAAYCDLPSITRWNCTGACSLTPDFEPVWANDLPLRDEGIGVFVGADHRAQMIVVAFRGTASNSQLLDELKNSHAVPYRRVKDALMFAYFLEAYHLHEQDLTDTLTYLTRKYPKYRVLATGHSLGGALSSIAMLDLVLKGSIDHKKTRIAIYTYGTPRIGNAQWANKFASTFSHAFRVVRHKDIVPHLPPCKPGGVLPIGSLCIPGWDSDVIWGAYHYPTEIWYYEEEEMNLYTVCARTDGEDSECSDSTWVSWSISEHSVYFGKWVSHFCSMEDHEQRMRTYREVAAQTRARSADHRATEEQIISQMRKQEKLLRSLHGADKTQKDTDLVDVSDEEARQFALAPIYDLIASSQEKKSA